MIQPNLKGSYTKSYTTKEMGLSFNTNKQHVYLFYQKQIKGQKIALKYYPGIKLDGQKIVKNRTGLSAIDKKLAEVEIAALEVIENTNVKNIDSKTFSKMVDGRLKNEDVKNDTNFYAYCDIYFNHLLEEKGYDFAKHIRKVKNKLKEYNPDLMFSDITIRFESNFKVWMEKKNYSVNYIGSFIKDIKRIMAYATRFEENSNMDYQKFKKPSEEVYNIYLSEDEIQKLYDLQITTDLLKEYHKKQEVITGHKKYKLSETSFKRQADSLNRAKDLFIIGCWTGLRVGNYLKIDPGVQVDLKNGIIHAIANKNGPKLKIPIHWMVKDIIVKNGFPGPMSEQKLNLHIKVLGELAGIDEEIVYSRTIGGKRKEFSSTKYKMITSHTCRRSFASNMEIRGIPRQYIMAITGHRSEKSYRKYIQAVSQDILTEKMKDFDVFKI